MKYRRAYRCRFRAASFALCLAAVVVAAPASNAQRVPTGGWPGRPRVPDGKLVAQLGFGGTRYFGEFTDNSTGLLWVVASRYAVLPFLDIGAEVHGGTITYLRRNRRNMGGTYALQFGDENLVERSTGLLALQGRARLNLLPGQHLNPFVEGGFGATMYSPEDYRNGDATYTARTPITALNIALGGGFEYVIARNLSAQFAITGMFIFNGEIDAFDSGELAALYDRIQNPLGNPDRVKTAYDKYLGISLGVNWYLFATDDSDGDRLTDTEEGVAGTNPYHADTDGDGLDDFLEVRRYGTNPLFWDSDGDGLSDVLETTKYNTNPLAKDSDGDGLDDREELLTYGTDPLSVDTDNDGLSDGDEYRLATHPRKVDTDSDGMVDGDEVVIWRTNPLLPDSDGDGINDYDEIYVHRTDPNTSDTDGDGLTDFEEIRLFRTGPLLTDTDGDGVSDYDEVRRFDTDPLRGDDFPAGAAQPTPTQSPRR
ncbi:MAG: MSCRAMM family adhesin SdrC [Bacteroidia bacterium]|nr:MSCRAMM family adhesin SdrC [Bacteroidia bacterium]